MFNIEIDICFDIKCFLLSNGTISLDFRFAAGNFNQNSNFVSALMTINYHKHLANVAVRPYIETVH